MLVLEKMLFYKKELSRDFYQICYFAVFVLVFLAYFLKRYALPSQFLLGLSLLAIISSACMYIWNIKREGLSFPSALGGFFAALFLIVLSPNTYLMSSISDLSLLTYFLLSVSVDRTDEKLLSKIFYLKLTGALLVLLAYAGHIIPDATMLRADGLVRHSYGFMHPNSLGMYNVSLLFDFTLIKKENRFSRVLEILFVTLLVFAITDSRTTLIISLLIISCYAFKTTLEKYSLSYKVLIPVIVLLFGIGVALPYYFNDNSHFYLTLNRLFSGRLGIGHEYLTRFGLDWFPRSIGLINDFDGRMLYNDSFFLDSLMHQGILLSLCYPVMLIAQLFQKRLNLFHSCLFLSTFLICMMEGYGASYIVCSVLLIKYFAFPEKLKVTNDKY